MSVHVLSVHQSIAVTMIDLLVLTAIAVVSSIFLIWGNNLPNNGSTANTSDLFVVSSANRNPIAGFCSSFMGGASGVIEIVQLPNGEKRNYEAYFAAGPVGNFFATWPSILPFNPQTPDIGPLEKNTEDTRRLVVSGTCLIRSPTRSDAEVLANPSLAMEVVSYYPPAPNTPPAEYLSSMNWIHIASAMCLFQYPELNTTISPSGVPPAGSVFTWITSLCVAYQYRAGTLMAELTDPWGNTYTMHSTNTANQGQIDISQVVLPQGWTIALKTVAEEFHSWPMRFTLPDGSLSNICVRVFVRDNLGNGYQQQTFGTRGALSAVTDNQDLFSVIGTKPSCVDRLVEEGLLSTDPLMSAASDYLPAPVGNASHNLRA